MLANGTINPIAAAASAVVNGGAKLTIVTNPLPGADNLSTYVQPGHSIRDLFPPSLKDYPTVARLNGQWLLRKDWDVPLSSGDALEFHSYPQGGGDSDPLRIIATIALIVVANVYGAELGAIIFGDAVSAAAASAIGTAIIAVAGSFVLNAIFRPDALSFADSPGSTPAYNVALQGNQAKLGAPIPVLYGYNRVFPNFVGRPYQYYQNNDQYYNALFCIGQGEYTVHSVEIDDTSIANFEDAYFKVLPPGVQPSRVFTNIATSIEVNGQEPTGSYVGPFSVCKPGSKLVAFEMDFAFAALGSAQNDGSFNNKTVTLRTEYRELDDSNNPLSDWVIAGIEDITGATGSAIRNTYRYELVTPARVEVRVVRVDLKEDNSRVFNTPSWAGLRGFVNFVASMDANATHLEVSIKANEQLSSLAQRRVAVRCTRKLPIYNGSTWSAPTETRSIAWALADKWRNTVYGDKLPDSYIDLDGLMQLDSVWSIRQDRFDFIFESSMTSLEADQIIASAGRAVVLRRQGTVRTVIRDEPQYAPLTYFTSNNIRAGTFSVAYTMPSEDQNDGITVEYWDSTKQEYVDLVCGLPGVDDDDVTNPLRVRLLGIIGRYHAEREGRFLAAAAFYRRKAYKWATDLIGLLPTYGTYVRVADTTGGSAVAGYVVEYEAVEGSYYYLLTEPVEFTSSYAYITFQKDDGTFTSAIQVRPGGSKYEVVSVDAPGLTIPVQDGSRDPVRFIFAQTTTMGRPVVVRSVNPAGKDDAGIPIVEISGLLEADEVHTADHVALVQEAGGDVPNPPPTDGGDGTGDLDPVIIPPPDDPETGDILLVPRLTTHQINRTEDSTQPEYQLRRDDEFILQLTDTGLLQYKLYTTIPGYDFVVFENEWSQNGPITAGNGLNYEVRISRVADPGDPNASSLDFGVWYSLDETRQWTLGWNNDADYQSFAYFSNDKTYVMTIEIRNKNTQVLEASAKFYLYLSETLPGQGGA